MSLFYFPYWYNMNLLWIMSICVRIEVNLHVVEDRKLSYMGWYWQTNIQIPISSNDHNDTRIIWWTISKNNNFNWQNMLQVPALHDALLSNDRMYKANRTTCGGFISGEVKLALNSRLILMCTLPICRIYFNKALESKWLIMILVTCIFLTSWK